MQNPFNSQVIQGFAGAAASADGRPERVLGGITLDTTHAAFTALAAAATLADGQVIPIGATYVPFGAILMETAGRLYQPWDGAAAIKNGYTVVVNTTCTSLDPDWDSPAGVFNGGEVYFDSLKIYTGGAWTAISQAQWLLLVAKLPTLKQKRMN